MKGRKILTELAAVAALAVLVAAPALAAPHSLATVHAGASSVEWQPAVSNVGMALTVSGPQGFYLRQEFKPGESATFSVFDKTGQVRPAGEYSWELTPIVKLDKATAAALQAAREAGEPDVGQTLEKAGKIPSVPKLQSGNFRIADQAIVAGGEKEPGARQPARPAGNSLSTKDQVIADDLIVQGSQCVGVDCVNNMSFGFDTLVLRENNLRMFFDDTSNSGSFPKNDWRLTANDSANGGASYFSIDDATAGKQILRVDAGAPSNSIYVASGGNVGFGTSTPAVDLQAVSGNTPTLRLDQDSSSGFSPQSWDVAGNETVFFVRDVTNGSKLPFKIEPNAATNSLVIDSSGNVGIGVGTSPSTKLAVGGAGSFSGSDGNTAVTITESSTSAADRNLLTLENNGPPTIFFKNDNASSQPTWTFTVNNSGVFQINASGSGAPTEMLLAAGGNMTIGGTLTTSGPTCSGGCDRVLSPDYKVEPIEKHAAEMRANSYLPAVGPTRPGAPINLSQKTGGILNELEMAHIYIAQLNDQVKAKQVEITALKKELDSLKATVNGLVDKK